MNPIKDGCVWLIWSFIFNVYYKHFGIVNIKFKVCYLVSPPPLKFCIYSVSGRRNCISIPLSPRTLYCPTWPDLRVTPFNAVSFPKLLTCFRCSQNLSTLHLGCWWVLWQFRLPHSQFSSSSGSARQDLTWRWVAHKILIFLSFNICRRVRQICRQRLLASSCLSCPSAWNTSAITGRIFVKFDFWVFFENNFRKLKFH